MSPYSQAFMRTTFSVKPLSFGTTVASPLLNGFS